MDVSRINSGKVVLQRKRMPLQALVESAGETARPLMAQAGHEFELELAPEPLWADVDSTRMAQVIENLLNNAAKYTPSGGRIVLALRRQADQALIEVRDSGVGIPQAMLSRVFDMFAQVENSLPQSQGGLGIGLSLVKKLVELHGGRADVVSDPNVGGCTFSVLLLLTDGAPGIKPVDGAAYIDDTLPPCRILVVDDNEDAADTLAMVLGLWGCETRTSFTGPDAIAVVQTFMPQIVLLDIGLPGMDGSRNSAR